MNFELPEIHAAVLDTVRRFADKELGEGLTPSALARFGELELWGVTLPERVGGSELDPLAYALIVESLAGASPALAHIFALHAGPASAALTQTDIDPAPLARGERASWTTPSVSGATRAPAPARWLAVSDHLTTRLYDSPAATPSPLMALDEAELSTFELGDPTAETAHPDVVQWADLGSAACCVGAGHAALRAALAYAKERKQFGKPIAEFQAIQWKLANAETELAAARLMMFAACTNLADAAAARVFAGRAAVDAASEALQVHGGFGYTREFPVEGLLRAIRIWTAAPDAARTRVAERAIRV